MNNTEDPAGRIPRHLLPHINLVSSHRYPAQPHLSLGTVVDYLIDAPKVTRDIAPMSWQFLDAPPDGTVMLQWQPLGHMGTQAATDGYVWAGPEAPFTTPNRGYVWRSLDKYTMNLLMRLPECGGVLSQKRFPTSR
ncbi:MAG: hypothetical protein Q9195_000073 [Heterodermia aff. obscurata]